MKKKSKLLPIVLIIIILFSGILTSTIIYFKSELEIYGNKNYALVLANEREEDKSISLIENDHIRFLNNNLQLNKDKYIFTNDTDSISLSSLVNKYNRLLVFRYSELNCMVCVDQELIHLKKMMKENTMKVVIVTTYEEMHDLFLFKRTNQLIDVDIYNIREPFANLPIERNNIPYYFVLDSNFSLKDLFVPNKLFNKHSVNYLESVIE